MFKELDKALCRLSYRSVIRPEDKLIEDLGFDSLKIIELIVAIEGIYSIEIYETDLDPNDFNTVEDLYKLIRKYTNKKEDNNDF